MKKEFKLNSDIYSEELILEGIQDFSEVTVIKISENILTIEGEDDISIVEVFNEFMNYLLSL